MRPLLLAAALLGGIAPAAAYATQPARIVDCEPDDVCRFVCQRLERLGVICLH